MQDHGFSTYKISEASWWKKRLRSAFSVICVLLFLASRMSFLNIFEHGLRVYLDLTRISAVHIFILFVLALSMEAFQQWCVRHSKRNGLDELDLCQD